MFDEVKTLLKWGVPAVVFAAGYATMIWLMSIPHQFERQVAKDITAVHMDIARTVAAADEANGHLKDGDMDLYMEVMDEVRDQREQNWERIADRYKVRDRAAKKEAAAVPAVVPSKRYKGTFHADDYVEPESASSAWALGAAGFGGLMVFLGTGLVSYRVLGSLVSSEDDELVAPTVDMEQAVLAGGNPAPHAPRS